MESINWDAITAITEILGVVAVVVSLLYLGFQVKQNTRQLRQDNLRETVRGTLDTNWYFHRDEKAFEVFGKGVAGFDTLEPQEKAHFHSIIVDLSFYLEVIRHMEMAGLIDRSALETNRRFLGGILITRGGREWLRFAQDTRPMPGPALDYLQKLVDEEGTEMRPITDLQPWFSRTRSDRQ
jgi:hypothetical protein